MSRDRSKNGERFVEDSTRGRALIRPVNYKNDVNVQSWVDSRKLATVDKWLREEGIDSMSLSELVRNSLEIVYDTIVREKRVREIDLSGEAREYLGRRFRTRLNPSGRGERNALHNLHLDEKRKRLRGESERDCNVTHNDGLDEIKAALAKVDREKGYDRVFKDPEFVSKPGDEEVNVNVEENVKKMEEEDEKLKDM